jgi:tripartite-type tricarboxylate transporter receptor subunit TctC
MRLEKRNFLAALVAALSLAALPSFAQAPSAWPEKPIHIIVPFTPGSATDVMARTFGERLTAALGQPVIVENHPGAGGTIGAGLVAKSPPDGYTLLVVSTGHVVNDVLYPSISYDTIGDFAGVAPLGSLPSVLLVPPSLGVKNVRELVALMKQRPGQLNYCTAGIGSASHINTEKFLTAAGVTAVHIPLKGTPEILNEIMSGRIEMSWAPLVSAIGPVKNGKVHALAVSTHQRSSAVPDIPTIAEEGFPGGEFNFWVGLLAPSKTPREVVRRLNDTIEKSLDQPEIRQRLANLGAEPMPMSPEQFDAFIRSEHDELGKVMRAAKM